MASQWMYDIGGLQFGPVSFLNLAELISSRQLGEDDLVRRNGSDDWTRASDVVGLMHAVRTIESGRAGIGRYVDPEPLEDEQETGRQRRLERAQALQAEADAITLRRRRRRTPGHATGSPLAVRILLAWMGLVAVVIASLAFYNHVHDPWANKRFEDPPVEAAETAMEILR